MAIKDQLLNILDKSRETELAFIDSLNEEEKAELGTYDKWSAKDNLAHANHWQELRASQALAWSRNEDFDRVPQYEQANVQVYEQFAESSWEDVGAFTERGVYEDA